MVTPFTVALNVTEYFPGCVAPFGPFGIFAQAAAPIPINTRTPNDSVHCGFRRYVHAKPPNARLSSKNHVPPPNPPGLGTDAVVVVPLQNVFNTIATSVGPFGVSVTEAGSGAHVIVGDEVVHPKVTVPLNPGVEFNTSPIASVPPGGTGGYEPPAGGVTVIVIGEFDVVSVVDPVTSLSVAEIVVVSPAVAPVVARPPVVIVAAS